jgi:hypothetical protein
MNRIDRSRGIGIVLVITLSLASSQPARGVPRVVKVDPQALPQIEKIATPDVRTLVGYTRRVLHLPDGHTLAVLSYSSSTAANWLFLIDSRDLSSQRFAMPNNDIGSHAAALGSDGSIYFMPYHTGRAYRFDVASREFSTLPKIDVPDGEYTWDAVGGDDGCIYFGTYPNACIGRYTIATGRSEVWAHVAPNTTYVSPVMRDAMGVHARAWGSDTVWFDLNATEKPKRGKSPKTDLSGSAGATTNPTPPPGEESLARVVEVNGRRFGVGFPSGKLYEFKGSRTAGGTGEAVVCGDSQAPAEPWLLETSGDAVIGISHYGPLFRYDLSSGAFSRGKLDNLAPGGNAIMLLEAITPDCVIGGNYSQQNLFRVNPETAQVQTSRQMIARATGQLASAVALNGKAYIGTYIHAILSVYDPAQPMQFAKNPRELAELFDQYHQTRPSAVATDGQLVYFGTEGDYAQLGGALAVVNPASEKVDAYPNLIPDQNVVSLAWEKKTGLLWGGTNRWGEMRSVAPTQPSALIFAFDPQTRIVARTLIPWEGADEVHVLGATEDGVVMAAMGDQIALIGTSSGEIRFTGRFPVPVVKLKHGADGALYVLGTGELYRWSTAQNTLMPVARTGACTMITEASPGCWVLADAVSVYRVRLKP